MDIIVKVRYGCGSQKVEPFGNNRYLVYLLSEEKEKDSFQELVALLSKKLGVPESRIELRSDNGFNKVFFVS